jgi:chemotaxis protein MotB
VTGGEPEESKAKVPAWMVSFGDMMTLILTFFILLVSMSRERQVGLVARGVGSFIVQLRTFGLQGLMENQEQLEIFNDVRVRFALPPVESLEELADPSEAHEKEVVRAQDIDQLTPPREFFQPAVAVFRPGSSALPADAREFLDLLAPSLRPGAGQMLVLEARPDGSQRAQRALAVERAEAVADHLVARHGVRRDRLEVRVWLETQAGTVPGTVDARVVTSGPSGGR